MYLQKLDGNRFDRSYHENCSEKMFESMENLIWYKKRLNQKKSLVFLAKMNDTFFPLLFWAMQDDIEIVFWPIVIALLIFLLLWKVEYLNKSPEADDDNDIQRGYRLQDNNNNNVFEDSDEE